MKASSATTRMNSRRNWFFLVVALLALGGVCLYVSMPPVATEQDQKREESARVAQRGDTDQTQTFKNVNPREIVQLSDEEEKISIEEFSTELVDLAGYLQKQFPRDANAHHVAAQIYVEFDRTQDAQASWQQCIALMPRHAGPYVGLVGLLTDEGQEEEAIRVSELATQRGIKASELSIVSAKARENLGEVVDALDELMPWTKGEPTNAKLWSEVGRIQNQLGRLADAEASLSRAVELGAETKENLALLVTILARQKKTQRIPSMRERLSILTKPVSSQQSDGGDLFQDALDASRRDLGHHVFLSAGSIAEHLGDMENAEAWTLRAQALRPSFSQAYMSLSGIYRKQGRIHAALLVHKRLLEEEPENIHNYTNLASVAMQAGQVALAESTLEEAMDLDDDTLVVRNALVQMKLSRGAVNDAKLLATKGVAQVGNANAYILLANVCGATGDPIGANAAIQNAQRLEPNHPFFQNMTKTNK